MAYTTTTSTSTFPIEYNYSTATPNTITDNFYKVTVNKEAVKDFYYPLSYSMEIKDSNEFIAIKQHVPNKVYTFTFEDKTKIKTVCSDEDVFDLEYAFYLALSKKLFSKELTFEGILRMVDEIRCQKYYVNLVKKGIKLFNKNKEEERKKKEEQEIKARQHKKYIEKKKKQKERRLERQAEILAKALNNKEGE